MARTLIVSIPGMIMEADLIPLRKKSIVDYCEMDNISENKLAEMCKGYDYLMLNMDVLPKVNNKKLSSNFYENPYVKKLKSIAVDMTGMDYFSPIAAGKSGVMLQNIPYYSSQSVAETIVSEILLHSRQRHSAYVDQINGSQILNRKGINLKDRTVGILGYGNIGSTVASILSCFGMNVLIWDRLGFENSNRVSIEDVFAKSDVICVTTKTILEGDNSNINFINKRLLEFCNNTIIVNLANELLVDVNDILDAVRAGKVSGYSFEASSETKQNIGIHSNIHFAPNNSWDSDESMQTLRSIWVSNIISAIDNNPNNVYYES